MGIIFNVEGVIIFHKGIIYFKIYSPAGYFILVGGYYFEGGYFIS